MTTDNKMINSDELAQRKKDHLDLTIRSQTPASMVDSRFNYEPLFFHHPDLMAKWPTSFLGKKLDYPLWISSMTGGTAHAKFINQNLAKLCGEFKLGMGLGSCRALLSGEERKEDFALRNLLGDQPFYANLGLAQLEELVEANKILKVSDLVKTLEADGIIIHINPLQEWFQPGGDRYKKTPLETLSKFLEVISCKVIIKEVGQGFGPKSLKTLLELPIAGIEFGAFGGTNFSLLESLRNEDRVKNPLINVGHTAQEMVSFLNALPTYNKEFIISGGIKNILDGYKLKMELKSPSVIGMAQTYLGPAQQSYEVLQQFFLNLRESLLIARDILEVKETNENY